jgi:ABC-2 type transport system permease protein
MRLTLLIARRELASFLKGMSGYIILAGTLALSGLFFNAYVLGEGAHRSSEVLQRFFYVSSGFTMIASVLISMRLLAEERQTGTLTLLYSSPVRDGEIVTGKFLAALGFLALYLALTLYMPGMILVHGKVSLGHLCAGYLGLLLLGAACLSIGLFGSALTRSQVLAAVLGGCLLVALLVSWLLGNVTERPFAGVFRALALYLHYQPFESGVVHVKDVTYFLLVTYVALFGATRVLEARRWK